MAPPSPPTDARAWLQVEGPDGASGLSRCLHYTDGETEAGCRGSCPSLPATSTRPSCEETGADILGHFDPEAKAPGPPGLSGHLTLSMGEVGDPLSGALHPQ